MKFNGKGVIPPRSPKQYIILFVIWFYLDHHLSLELIEANLFSQGLLAGSVRHHQVGFISHLYRQYRNIRPYWLIHMCEHLEKILTLSYEHLGEVVVIALPYACNSVCLPEKSIILSSFREALLKKKNVFFRALPKFPLPPPSPQFGQLVPLFFGRQKRRFSAYYRTK